MELVGSVILESARLFAEMSPYILLGLTAAGLLSVLVSRRFVVKHLGKAGLASVFKASLFGVPLPLCSCSVVPTASYFTKSGASRPSVVSFLISTHQTGVDSIVATYGMLGPLFAIIRPVAALIAGVVGGSASAILGRRDNADAPPEEETHEDAEEERGSVMSRVRSAWDYAAVEAVDDLSGQFLIGVAIAGAITVLLPADFFLQIGLSSGILAMLAMILVGTPMYICATSSIPVVIALIAKGLSPGAAYVFLVAGPATNIATLLILAKVIGRRDTAVFVGTILVTSVLFGLVVEWMTASLGWMPRIAAGTEEHTIGWLEVAASVGLSGLVLASWGRALRQRLRKRRASRRQSSVSAGGHISVIPVEGMTCDHCEQTVENAVRNAGEDLEVLADRSSASVKVAGSISMATAIEAIRKAGYTVPVEDMTDPAGSAQQRSII